MIHSAVHLKSLVAVIFTFLILTGLSVTSDRFVMNVHAASGTNIALDKPAASSCSTLAYTPNKAVDGSLSPSSRWYCATGITNDPKWLRVDLGKIYLIDGYSVAGMGQVGGGWGDDLNPKNFRLQKSDDDSAWVDVDTVTGNALSTVNHDLTPFTARYVRLYVDYGNQFNNTWTSIMDFQVFGAELGTNADLSGLVLSSGELNKPFDSSTLDYTQSVGYATDNVTVTPTVADVSATVQVKAGSSGTYTAVTSGTPSAALPLEAGPNTIYVKVTAQDGTTEKEYRVTVTRAAIEPGIKADLSSLVANDGTTEILLNPAFAPENTMYTATVTSGVYNGIHISASAADPLATVGIKENGREATGAVYFQPNEVLKVIQVTVTPHDQSAVKTYTINVFKDINVEGISVNNLIQSLTNLPDVNGDAVVDAEDARYFLLLIAPKFIK